MTKSRVPSSVWLLGALMGVHGLVIKMADVTCTAGVVANSGSTGLAQVWTLDVFITLGVGAWLTLLADRMPRSTLLARLLVGVGLGYVGVAALMGSGLAPTVSYWLLYMVSTAEVAAIPVTAWAIAADTIEPADNVRWFSRIAAAESIADVAGYTLALGTQDLAATAAERDTVVVGLSAALCFASAMFAARKLPASTEPASGSPPPPLVQALDDTPWLRPVVVRVTAQTAASVVLGWAAMRDLEVETAAQDEGFRRWFAVYSLASTLAVLSGQALLPHWLVQFDRWKASLVLPIYIIGACMVAVAVHDPRFTLTVFGGYFVVSAAFDAPLRRSLLADLDERVRGRLLVLLDVHAYAIGSLLGTAVVMTSDAWLPRGSVRAGVAVAAVILAVGQLLAAVTARRRTTSALRPT